MSADENLEVMKNFNSSDAFPFCEKANQLKYEEEISEILVISVRIFENYRSFFAR